MGEGPWHEGQQAWRRLAGRYQDVPQAPGPIDLGELALTALSDVGVVRRLLDQAEFESVQTARRQRKSWSEIATRLGVTRQSAWERWRDVDDTAPSTGLASQLGTVPASDVDAVAQARRVLSGPVEEMVSARERRGLASVEVPNVIGLSWGAARTTLLGNGLVPASSDPDGPPLAAQS